MFPYPSGRLHMGHVRNYTMGDVLTRYMRMQGYNVLQPMGWDAFGLPAENAAMKNGVPPAKWTYDNISYMKGQLQQLGFALDWKRELATCQPEYYRWNQWLFLRMLERGIAYKKTGVVNWDPVDQTVLANEQVIDGRGWRTGALVEKREIPMYYLRITQYAQDLLDELDHMTEWPERVRAMQANWIGRSEGVRIGFPYELEGERRVLSVFTTRADTLMGATFCAVAAEHPLATFAARNESDARGVRRGVQARHGAGGGDRGDGKARHADRLVRRRIRCPASKIPVWVGNYVLMTYGEGAVMGVPGHDERDFDFALKYGLPIQFVIRPTGWRTSEAFSTQEWRPEYAEYGVCINSGKYDGLDYQAAVDAIAADLQSAKASARSRCSGACAIGVSRGNATGAARSRSFSVAKCGDVPVPDEDLPVVLPENLVPDGTRQSAQQDAVVLSGASVRSAAATRGARRTRWIRSSIRRGTSCASPAVDDDKAMVDERADYWMAGRSVHRRHRARDPAPAVFALLDARDARHGPDQGQRAVRAAADARHGAQSHLLARAPVTGASSISIPTTWTCSVDAHGAPHQRDAAQRRPAGRVGRHAHDVEVEEQRRRPDRAGRRATARTASALFMMFKAPPEDTLEWSDDGVEGSARFLRRLWRMVWEHLEKGPLAERAAAGTRSRLSPAQREIAPHVARDAGQGDGRLRSPPRLQHCDRCGDGAHERAPEVRRCQSSRAAPCVTRRSS